MRTLADFGRRRFGAVLKSTMEMYKKYLCICMYVCVCVFFYFQFECTNRHLMADAGGSFANANRTRRHRTLATLITATTRKSLMKATTTIKVQCRLRHNKHWRSPLRYQYQSSNCLFFLCRQCTYVACKQQLVSSFCAYSVQSRVLAAVVIWVKLSDFGASLLRILVNFFLLCLVAFIEESKLCAQFF